MRVRAAELVVVAATCALAGCASNTSLTGARSAGAVPQRCFWPPPPSTSLWTPRTIESRDRAMAELGSELTAALRQRGYEEQRWFPIGAEFAHGFAVTTRLERVETETATSGAQRWLAGYPEPANLFWLSGVSSVRLPQPGQYRVLLVAFTDLPLGPTRVAPSWNRDTLMAGPEVPESLTAKDVPQRRLESARLGAFVYVYERPPGAEDGSLTFAEAPRGADDL